MNAYAQRQYQQTQVTTVDKGRLIVLLYDGAIKFLRQAADCTLEGDLPGKAANLNRALDIIEELNQSLNMEVGGDLAANLKKLYLFWTEHLIQAKVNKDPRNIEDVIRMMTSLNEAWNHIVSQPEAQDAVPKNQGTSIRTQVRV